MKNKNRGICCFLADTFIRMGDGSEKKITDVRIGDLICTIDGDVQEVGCDTELTVDSYYIVETENRHEIKITGNHPMLTEDGWKKVEVLLVGDKVVYISKGSNEIIFEKVKLIQMKEEKTTVYNLICEEKPLIVNGFVCSDFHMQYKMELIAQLNDSKNL